MVQRIVALGFEIRVEFVLADGTEVWAQLTRAELQRLELREGQIAYLRPVQAKSFNGSSPSDARWGLDSPRAHGRRRRGGICSRLKRRRAGCALPGGAPPRSATARRLCRPVARSICRAWLPWPCSDRRSFVAILELVAQQTTERSEQRWARRSHTPPSSLGAGSPAWSATKTPAGTGQNRTTRSANRDDWPGRRSTSATLLPGPPRSSASPSPAPRGSSCSGH